MTIQVKPEKMKTLFLHAKSLVSIILPQEAIEQLPKRVGLVSSIQHTHKLKNVQEQLKGKGIIGGQVLGCRAEAAQRISDKVDAYLFIGTGKFHPIRVALDTKKIVYCWDPANKLFFKITDEDLKPLLTAKKSALTKYYLSQRIGVLISVKHGQCDIQKIEKLLKLSEDKEFYYFAFDTLPWEDLENYPFIQMWVNTACNRIPDLKTNMIDIDDLFRTIEGKEK